ncbi:hypothetical protein V8C86DRAFT_2438128 [Haematococcus lacustris]
MPKASLHQPPLSCPEGAARRKHPLEAASPTIPPPALTVEETTKVLKGKVIRLASDTVLAYTGYSSGEGLMLPDEDDINSLNPGNWMSSCAFSSLINSMQFWKPSAYDGPRPMLLPVELARVFSPIFDSNTPTPAPVEAWQELFGYFYSVHRVQELKSAACIILPVHHDNHYFFLVFFRQVKRVVFFDSGKQFNPNWPTQLMKDTFTEVAEEIFSEGDERWVFEEGTITQQPDAIHCADYTLTGINAILQAADVRYWRAIDLAHINMASQRRTWLKPYLEVTVRRMIEEQEVDFITPGAVTAQASNADDIEPTVVEGAVTAAPQDVVAAEQHMWKRSCEPHDDVGGVGGGLCWLQPNERRGEPPCRDASCWGSPSEELKCLSTKGSCRGGRHSGTGKGVFR